MARPKKNIDWKEVDKYLVAGATGTEVAAVLGIHPETLYGRCKEDHKIGFSDYHLDLKKDDTKINDIINKDDILKEKRKRDHQKRKPKVGYVYLVKCEGTDFYKIGISKSTVKNRLSSLQSGCPFKLTLLHKVHCNHYSLLESELHKKYSKHRGIGEWFKLSDSLVLCVISDMNDQANKQLKLF